MARITVENFKDQPEDQDKILVVKGTDHYSPSGVADSIKRILAAAKAMWPDSVELKRIHIVELNK